MGKLRSEQYTFKTKAEAEKFYTEARRLKLTVSFPFKNHKGQWQIIQIR